MRADDLAPAMMRVFRHQGHAGGHLVATESFGISFHAAKEGFFDTPKVMAAIDAATRVALSRYGAILMRSARGSMKPGRRTLRRKGIEGEWELITHSKPGEPPRVQKGQLKRFLLFSWDAENHSVVVGPSKLPRSKDGQVPGILEFGGTEGVRNPRRTVRRIGDGGEIALDRPGGRTTKPNKAGRLVTYAKIRTGAQAARANLLNEILYGPAKITARIAARPYMGPALSREASKLPPMWAGSVHS